MKPHICVLGIVEESNIGMGRQLLASCLNGENSERIKKLNLHKLVYYDSLPLYDKKDVFELVDLLVYKGFLKFVPVKNNKFMKVLELTDTGKEELKNPNSDLKLSKSFDGFYSEIQKITKQDKETFETLGEILQGMSDEQKKAVICTNKNILCIAGAGSGKTKVLTKRAWFLSKYKSVEKILCITFTRKARNEMLERLNIMYPDNNIEIETFNSYCEGILRKHESKIYDKPYKVMDFRTQISLIRTILSELKINIDTALNLYYTKRQLYSKDKNTLFLGFIHDIFSLLDYQRNNNISSKEIQDLIYGHYDFQTSEMMHSIITKIKTYKIKMGMRDFTDQIVHVINFFKEHPEHIPKFQHILVDEYQDINSLQFELLELLNPDNLFVVGDPRQSIYGWRGSKIEFILDFEKLYTDTAVLQLSTNYRSKKMIVDVSNKVIKTMKLPDLKTSNGEEGKVVLIKHDNEDIENLFVVQSILALDIPRNEIFVLARTNKEIEKISEIMDKNKIRYIKRTIEQKKTNLTPEKDQVTLSTIHAIKGLEADTVYLIGVGAKNFPCKASEHPLLEAVKINDTYDKFEEERRLVYVAVSRAKNNLIINYTGKITSFIDEELFKFLTKGKKTYDKEPTIKYKTNKALLKNTGTRLYQELKDYRYNKSQELKIPAYQIFSDKTLDELCSEMPTSFDELQNISGFGPFKVRKFGRDIVAIVINNS